MEIISQKLTQSSFREFGDILSIENKINFTTINNGFTHKYDLSKFIGNKNNSSNKVAISIFRGLKRPNPIKINMLECHPLGSQSFMPLNGGSWVVIVCKGDSKEPNLKDFQYFMQKKKRFDLTLDKAKKPHWKILKYNRRHKIKITEEDW